MSYVARHYVRISECKYTPGEIIDIPIPEEKLKRLLRLKAIERVPTVIDEPTDGDAVGEDGDGAEDARHNYTRQLENLGYDPSGNSMDEAHEGEESSEEADEEAEAPKIDVMDGIVSTTEAIGEAPQKETKKKTTSKGRKKA